MKKLLIGFIALTSISSFSQEYSITDKTYGGVITMECSDEPCDNFQFFENNMPITRILNRESLQGHRPQILQQLETNIEYLKNEVKEDVKEEWNQFWGPFDNDTKDGISYSTTKKAWKEGRYLKSLGHGAARTAHLTLLNPLMMATGIALAPIGIPIMILEDEYSNDPSDYQRLRINKRNYRQEKRSFFKTEKNNENEIPKIISMLMDKKHITIRNKKYEKIRKTILNF